MESNMSTMSLQGNGEDVTHTHAHTKIDMVIISNQLTKASLWDKWPLHIQIESSFRL